MALSKLVIKLIIRKLTDVKVKKMVPKVRKSDIVIRNSQILALKMIKTSIAE